MAGATSGQKRYPPVTKQTRTGRHSAVARHFITWDEGSSNTDAIMAVAISPMLASPGSQDSGNYTHCSLLSTVEAGFGLSSLPGPRATTIR